MAKLPTTDSPLYKLMTTPQVQAQQTLNKNMTRVSTQQCRKDGKKKKKCCKDVKAISSVNSVQKKIVDAVSANNCLLQTVKSSRIDCTRCNSARKKCYRHLNVRSRNHVAVISCKTPEQTVLKLKKHMLKLVSGEPGPICKSDPRTGALILDLAKMHHLYLLEHEPQILASSSGTTEDKKPLVKLWLYRKILLDEFQGVDFLNCKLHLAQLKKSLDSASSRSASNGSNKKKKAKMKSIAVENSSQPAKAPPCTNEVTESTNSIENKSVYAAATTNSYTTALHHNSYQLASGNLLSMGNCPSMSSPTASTLHPPLSPYITSQVAPNLLFGLSSQQQPTQLQSSNSLPHLHSNQGHTPALVSLSTSAPHPGLIQHSQHHVPPQLSASSTQQQPLNLQTNHPSHHTASLDSLTNVSPLAPQNVDCSAALPLNLHSPYYVSLSPMLPLHMGATSSMQHPAGSAHPHTHPHLHHGVSTHHQSHVTQHHQSAHHHHHHHHTTMPQLQHSMINQHPQNISAPTFNPHVMY